MMYSEESMDIQTPVRVYNTRDDYVPTSEDMSDNIEGGMQPEIADQYANLANMARQKLKSRKPIYDWKTKNKSFLKMYDILYKMGIQNNKFFLRLYDRDLLGIDPYFPGLPLELQLKVALECMINPWYYLREVARIPADGLPICVGGGVPFKLDRGNLATWYCFLNGIDHYSSKPRQQGKTQDAVAKCVYAYHFGCLSTQFLFFNKDQDLAKTNLYRFKCQRDMLPLYLQMRILMNDDGTIDKGVDNVTTMRNPITNNTISVMPKASSKAGAMKLGRGNTAAIHMYDEFDYIPFNTEILNAAAFSYSTASANASKNHSLYGRLFLSTPGDASSRDTITANKYISHMLTWKEKFFDDPINKVKSIINSPSYNGVMFIEHTWRQLGLSVEWYETQCRMVDYDEVVILREIDLQRISGNNNSPFKRSDLIYLNTHKSIPIREEDVSKNYCPWVFYEELHREYPYIISNDPSEGLARDNNAITVINPYTLKPAVEFKSPYISQDDMSDMLIQFMDKYCPKSMIVIENNKGREMINHIRKSKYRYNLWYDVDKLNQTIVESTDKYGALRQSAIERRAFGLNTARSNRPKYYAILENLVEEHKDKLVTEFIVKDILGLVRKANGKIEAGEGEDNHDDNVMSYLMGLFVYYNASNLEEFGIRRGATAPPTEEELNDPRKLRECAKTTMTALPEYMQNVFKDYVNEKDPVEAAWEYQKQLDAVSRAQQAKMTGQRDITDPSGRYFEPGTQETMWNQLDRDIFDSNFGRDTEVNLEDFIGE